jgi:hypothetical protein
VAESPTLLLLSQSDSEDPRLETRWALFLDSAVYEWR